MFPPNTKVLIIDDMRTMRMIVKKTLVGAGFTNITEADDGATAWPLLEQALASGSPFDLILSDWNMPQLSGLELLRRVRTHVRLKNTPFLMITAETEKTQIMEAAKLGVSSYIPKPFTQQIVVEKLEAVYKKITAAKSAA